MVRPTGTRLSSCSFSKYEVDYDDFFQELRVTRAVDIVNFIHSAAIQSGNMRLASYVNRLDEVLKNIVVAHRQTDGKHDYIYNVYTNLSFYSFSQEERESYHKCRFDQLTGGAISMKASLIMCLNCTIADWF